jgi:large subunit ribosomal protein L30
MLFFSCLAEVFVLQKRVLESLGLRGIGKEVTHDASPSILGMIEKVKHLVSVTKL